MRVLVGCEESGKVRHAFRLRGHDAWSNDIVEARDGGPHIRGCILSVIHNSGPWDLIILHWDCTATAVSGNHLYAEGKPLYHERRESIEFGKELWREAKIEAEIGVCFENPVSVIFKHLDGGKTQYIQPNQFGHDASKKTGLHLIGLPKLKPTKLIEPRWVSGKPRWANQTDSGQNRLGPSPTRKRDRAETYQGIADAMAEQWGGLI